MQHILLKCKREIKRYSAGYTTAVREEEKNKFLDIYFGYMSILKHQAPKGLIGNPVRGCTPIQERSRRCNRGQNPHATFRLMRLGRQRE